MSRVAFYAPMKPPDHPTPSGDRRIAEDFMALLRRCGHRPFIASRLRLRDGRGCQQTQARLTEAAQAEAQRLRVAFADDPPALWFTYHCYWKAPDLLGPAVAQALGIPYVIAEPSYAASRLTGPWAGFAAAARAALERADRLIVTKPRDRAGVASLARAEALVELPPFLDPGPRPGPRAPGQAVPAGHLQLLTVAMMRPGDKRASYDALADALRFLSQPWRLTVVGDGPERPAIEALFAAFSSVSFLGMVSPTALRALYESHDVMLWPGVGEGIGMVYLEAQAAGCPALAAAHPGPAAVLRMPNLPAPGDAVGFALAAQALAADPTAREAARGHVTTHHGLDRAAQRLRAILSPLTACATP
ncbi:MAG: glycosyltransferase [Pseudomonadota bacterium]